MLRKLLPIVSMFPALALEIKAAGGGGGSDVLAWFTF